MRVISVQGVCVEKGGVELEKDTCVWYAKTQSHEFIHSNTCSAKELLPIIRDFAELKESEIYIDGLKSYGALVDFLLRYTRNFARRSKGTL